MQLDILRSICANHVSNMQGHLHVHGLIMLNAEVVRPAQVLQPIGHFQKG
jgi:hypothetical protein